SFSSKIFMVAKGTGCACLLITFTETITFCAETYNGAKENKRLIKKTVANKGKSLLIIRAVHFAGESNKYCLKRNDKVSGERFLILLKMFQVGQDFLV
ncbi:MAG TPA: hypothetical protein VN726_12200, partial [Hanamia sp.]|nr:hypothetical protein [Hanamia sp.]